MVLEALAANNILCWIAQNFGNTSAKRISINEIIITLMMMKPKSLNFSTLNQASSNVLLMMMITIVYYRRLESYKGKFKASEFKDFYDFYNSVYKADRTRVVLVKS